MPTFEYEALDQSGRTKRGVVTAETARRARAELRRLNLTPIGLASASEKSDKAAIGSRPVRISQRELVPLTRQLSVLLGAGAPLEEALSAIALQADSPRVRTRLLAVRERVMEGWRFADALGEDPKSFSGLYRAVVAAGEASGDLSPVLDRLATMLEKNRAMRSKAIGALVYPAGLAIFASGVVAALMTLVVPRIIEQFSAFDAQLPLITRIVIVVAEFLGAYGLVILLALVAGSIAFWRGMKAPAFKLAVDQRFLMLPLLGKLLRGLDGARYARTLATLSAGGAPLLESLTGAGRTVSNAHIRKRLDHAVTQVREGATLAGALKRAEALPPMMVHMVAAGERAGELPKLLDKAADQLEEEFDTVSTVTLRLLEPIIIFLMGGVVGVIVISIMLPMLQLNRLAAG